MKEPMRLKVKKHYMLAKILQGRKNFKEAIKCWD